MPQLKQQYTATDYFNLPEGTRAELIEGTLYNMAPPSVIHQRFVMELSATLRNYIKKNKGSCEVFPAPFAVDLDANDKTYVEPDISVICDLKKLTATTCKGAPDFIIEVVSPSSRRMDYYIKLFKYRTAGVREYWIVNPAKQTVMVYDMVNDAEPVTYTFQDSIKVNIFQDLQLIIEDLLP